jgi:hypothetical protein
MLNVGTSAIVVSVQVTLILFQLLSLEMICQQCSSIWPMPCRFLVSQKLSRLILSESQWSLLDAAMLFMLLHPLINNLLGSTYIASVV